MKSAEEIEKQIKQEALLFADENHEMYRSRHNVCRMAYEAGAKKYAAQDRWVKVDKDNLPKCEVLAINDRKNILVGYLNYTYGVFTCSDEHQQLPYVTHYQIPTDPKD